MLTDISLNSRDVPIITGESPNSREIPSLSKEQIFAEVVEALELRCGHVHKPKAKKKTPRTRMQTISVDDLQQM